MSGIKEVKPENVKPEVGDEPAVGLFTRIGGKMDKGVKYISDHKKPIIGGLAAAGALAAGIVGWNHFNSDSSLESDNLIDVNEDSSLESDNLIDVNEEDPLA